jgi:Flp pilus assembly protein TadD
MMVTLNLFTQLLARARNFHDGGHSLHALSILRRLASFRDLPADVAEEVHARLGEAWLRRRRFRRARRHLTVALRHRPDCARYHFLLGLALHHDPAGDLARAARCYRRCLRLAPDHLRCLTEAGLLALLRGRHDKGLDLLRRAAESAPDDAGILDKLVQGLCQTGQSEEAVRLVRSALFRHPRCPRLRRVWIDLEIMLLRRRQETARARQDPTDGPVLLPFIRLVGKLTPSPKTGGEDEPAALPGPHLVRIRPRRSRRRVP